MYVKKLGIFLSLMLLLAACNASNTAMPSAAPSQPSSTPPAGETKTPKKTIIAPTSQSIQTWTEGIAPYPDAPLCPDAGEAHDHSLFHTLWDSARGCHYDHEHGHNPFTPEVAAAFPGFDLRALLGGVGVGHTNPSSPMENTHKHGGFKWDVVLSHTTGCDGKEGAPTGVDAFVIQFHGFGNYSIEFDTRIHSAVGLLRQCRTDNPTDFGYIYVSQFQDYGQRTATYQGVVLPYQDSPQPSYKAGLKPYFFMECMGGIPPCDKYPTRQSFLDRGSTNSSWVSEPDHLQGSGSPLFGLKFQVRDTYQVLDWRDQEQPFTFVWMCSSDDGLTYDPAGCQFNNSTTQVVELGGAIPAAWDNLDGFDTDPRIDRITAEGYVTRFGELNSKCTAPSTDGDCFPIKMQGAFVGRYGSFIVSKKFRTTDPPQLPERDLYFCNGMLCAEGNPGAVPSSWIGQNN